MLLVYTSFFQTVKSVLKFSVLHETLDTGLSGKDFVKREALRCCNDKSRSSFLCLLGVSLMAGRKIVFLHPDRGFQKFQKLFNNIIFSRDTAQDSVAINILFC